MAKLEEKNIIIPQRHHTIAENKMGTSWNVESRYSSDDMVQITDKASDKSQSRMHCINFTALRGNQTERKRVGRRSRGSEGT